MNAKFLSQNLSIIGLTLLPFFCLANSSTVGSSQAHLLTALAATNTSQMDFGVILPDGADEIVMRPASDNGSPIITRSSTSGGSVLTGTYNTANFDIQGEPNMVVNITTSSSATLTGPGDDMVVDDLFTQDYNPVMQEDGLITIRIGGSLNINEAQAPGDYSGTFAVTFTYQ